MILSVRRHAILFLLSVLSLAGLLPAQQADLSQYRIRDIDFRYLNRRLPPSRPESFHSLVNLAPGDKYNALLVRKAMDHLFRMGRFLDIIVQVQTLPKNKVNLTFILERRLRIRALRFEHDMGLKTKRLHQAVFSLRRGAYLYDGDMDKAVKEIRAHLQSEGYFSPQISSEIQADLPAAEATIVFMVKTGRITRISELSLEMARPMMKSRFTSLLQARQYIPRQLHKRIESIRTILRKSNYYFPQIEIREDFLNSEKSRVHLTINIDPGYRYEFRFLGMRKRMGLIESIWKSKVFERWAEAESRARILRYLKNKGFLDARVESSIATIGNVKSITFNVDRRRRYRLRDINFKGNQTIAEEKLLQIIKTDDQVFDRLVHLRLRSLLVDLEVLKLYYYFNGFPQVVVKMIPALGQSRADILFDIREGRREMVESIQIRGNRLLKRAEILELMRTRQDEPFVPQRLSEDLQRISRHYRTRGYADIRVEDEISAGIRKSILITVHEGTRFLTGDLIILEASKAQRELIRSLFPLQKGEAFNRDRLEQFRTELENSPAFNDIAIEEIRKTPGIIDVMIKSTPDNSRYYGFGLGWEDRRGYRGTLEFQQQNFLSSYSSFSAMLQAGPKERRWAVSIDTPYFLRSRLSSSLRFWQEDQVYPSYKYIRSGISQSVIHRITQSSYISASLKWYRTRLTELDISPGDLDRVDQPFDTTAFSLLYVNDQRDNPFNPTRGDFFSSNLIIGFPLLEKEYSFFKFFWNFQKNFLLFRHGTLSLSIRNGFGSGDMSITERFFAGGIHTFRGTGNDRLGPIDSRTGAPRGGNAIILFNIEAAQPLYIIPAEGFQVCVFADIGDVFAETAEFSLKRLETALGFGIKYITPLGPIRVDFAWNINKARAEDPFLVKIGFGNVF
ncbi:MAG: BamA/TamA family outer membrane protein [Candidatus Aminicenantes bacterium]|nr:BamA/TamA family outer membrane protein [Candidatus Aminicenantes bacterium]